MIAKNSDNDIDIVVIVTFLSEVNKINDADVEIENSYIYFQL